MRARHARDGGASALPRRRVEARAAHRHDLLRVVRPDRGDAVAGVDGALEGVGTVHGDDVGNHRDIEERGHAGQVVLAGGGVRREDVVVIGAEFRDEQSHVLGEMVCVRGVVRAQHAGDTRHRSRCLGDRAAVRSRDQQVDLAADLKRRGEDVQRDRAQRLVVVFRDDKSAHYSITFASFLSFSTS